MLGGAAFGAVLILGASRFGAAGVLALQLVLLGTLLALPSVVRGLGRRWNPFDPIVGFTMICGMGYFVRTIHLWGHEGLDLYHIPVDSMEAIDLLSAAAWLVILGVLSFYVGYGSRIGPALAARLPVLAATWSPGRTRIVWIFFTLVGAGVYFGMTARAGGILYIVTNLEMRSEIAAGNHFFYMLIRWMPMGLVLRQVLLIQSKASRLSWFSFSVHALVVLLLLAVLGSRAWALEILFVMLVVRHYLYRRIRMASLALVAACALVTFGIYHQYRNLTHDGVEAQELRTLELDSIEPFYNGILGGRNFDMMDNLLSIVYFVDDRFSYLQGSSYLHFFVNLVPRSLWEGKPKGVSALLVDNVYGWGLGGAPPGAIGEAYLNYSVFGVVPALLLLGLFARTVAAYASSNRHNPFAVLLLGIAFVYVVMVTRGSFFKVGTDFLMRLVPLLAGALFACGARVQRRHLPTP